MKISGLKKKIGISILLLLLVICATVCWGYAHLTTLVQTRLKTFVGSDVKVGNVTARWNRIELDRVQIPRSGEGSFANRFSFERVVIRPSLLSLFSGRLDIKEILIEKPYLLLEIKPNGTFAQLMPPRVAAPTDAKTAALPLRIAAIRISDGTMDLLDWQIAGKGRIGVSHSGQHYHLMTMQNVSFSAGAINIPFSDQQMPVRFELSSKGGGHLLITGDIAPSGLNSQLKIELTDLNILPYRPYFIKRGDLNITSGILSATSSLSTKKRILNASGVLHLKSLAFDHSSTKGKLLGIPARGMVAFMSDSKDDLSVPFRVDGNLDNPHFSVQQNLLEQVTTALSSKLGIPTVTGVGKGLLEIGKKGIKGIFGIKEKKK